MLLAMIIFIYMIVDAFAPFHSMVESTTLLIVRKGCQNCYYSVGKNLSTQQKSRRTDLVTQMVLSESEPFNYSVWPMAIATSAFVLRPGGSGFRSPGLAYGDVEDPGDLVSLEEQIPCIVSLWDQEQFDLKSDHFPRQFLAILSRSRS
jgi:hypothetical protein